METPPPEAIDPESLAATLARRWAIDVRELEYLPEGAGAYHWRVEHRDGLTVFVTVDDLDTKPWLGRELDAAYAGLVAAYTTAWALHEEGLEFVVAPIRTDDGAVTVRIDERYSVAVFPFVAGVAGRWGEAITADARRELLDGLARLHRAPPGRPGAIRRRPHVLPERAELEDGLAAVGLPWAGGPRADTARRALAANAAGLCERLARFDQLAARLDHADADPVVTHGEPHPGNLIRTGAGLRLLDWDTVGLAEPERDLWMLANEGRGLDAYAAATGYVVDDAAIEYHRLAWTLSDIASLTTAFRTGERAERAEHHWPVYVALLDGASSAPYGAA